MAGVAACEAQPLGSEAVEVGGLGDFFAVAVQIAVAQVVGQDQDEVGAVGGQADCGGKQQPGTEKQDQRRQ